MVQAEYLERTALVAASMLQRCCTLMPQASAAVQQCSSVACVVVLMAAVAGVTESYRQLEETCSSPRTNCTPALNANPTHKPCEPPSDRYIAASTNAAA